MNIEAECVNGKIKVYTNTGSKIVDDNSIHIKEILELENEIELLNQEKEKMIEDINYRYSVIGRLYYIVPTIFFLFFEFLCICIFSITNVFTKLFIIPFIIFSIKKIKNNINELLISKNQSRKPIEFIEKDIIKLNKKIKELSKKPKYSIYRNSEKLYINNREEIVTDKLDLYNDYVIYSNEYKKSFLNSTLRDWLIDSEFTEDAIESFINNINEDIEEYKNKKLTRRR